MVNKQRLAIFRLLNIAIMLEYKLFLRFFNRLSLIRHYGLCFHERTPFVCVWVCIKMSRMYHGTPNRAELLSAEKKMKKRLSKISNW